MGSPGGRGRPRRGRPRRALRPACHPRAGVARRPVVGSVPRRGGGRGRRPRHPRHPGARRARRSVARRRLGELSFPGALRPDALGPRPRRSPARFPVQRSGARSGRRAGGGAPDGCWTAQGGSSPMTPELERRLTAEVTAALVEAMRAHEGAGRGRMDLADQRVLAAKLVGDALEGYAAECISGGRPPLEAETERTLARAVLDRLFAAAGLQPLLEDRNVVEVNAHGCDEVWVRHADGALQRGPVLAASDAELIELIRTLARDGLSERRFDAGCPRLSLQLPNGDRLFAAMAVCP